MLTFSNRSFTLFALKKYFLMAVKAPHSMRKCLTLQGIWHFLHCGGCSCLSIKKCISLVRLMYNWAIIICSFFGFCESWSVFSQSGFDQEEFACWSRLSSSCHPTSVDLPDPLLPPFSIIHHSQLVFKATSCISTELLYVGSSWSSCLYSPIEGVHRSTFL